MLSLTTLKPDFVNCRHFTISLPSKRNAQIPLSVKSSMQLTIINAWFVWGKGHAVATDSHHEDIAWSNTALLTWKSLRAAEFPPNSTCSRRASKGVWFLA
ncbi:hypothetical protein VCRA2120O333_20396 [Vibrio crassostreae]|nr:hypothetical protein VCRA2121O334_20397 [Vibrio crassostreae]CAK3658174.1 hypothetical protein VCRA2122O341_70147 [Vibrio crassostreae]CAK3874396.1 hypothetical protein VCRA2120O333_20396 [Vibrio crassostreae]